MKKAIVLLANGFEEIEALATIDILRRLDIEVTTLSIGDIQVAGAHGVTILADALLNNTEATTADILILPGGAPGSWNLRDSAEVISLIRNYHSAGKWIAALCAAPIALAKAGVLEGIAVTAYPAAPVTDELTMARYTGNLVEQDGRIITGKGPGAAIEFAFRIAAALDKSNIIPAMRQEMILEN